VSEEEEALRMFDEFLAKRKRDEASVKPAPSFEPVPPDITALEWCVGVIQGRFKYDAQIFRCAQAVLPYQNPKLAAIVVASPGGDFADRLSASRRQFQVLSSPGRVIEVEPEVES
jgi:hypothetical protein